MTRARTCEHMAACQNEDGTAIDGGTAMGCDMRPCTECGALCPGSSWTPEGSIAELDREQRALDAERNANAERILRFLTWKESRGR